MTVRRIGGIAALLGLVLCSGLAVLLTRKPPGRDSLSQAETAYRERDWARAAADARTVLRTSPEDQEALRLLARASARLGKDELAETLYRRLGAAAMKRKISSCLARG